MISSVLEMAHKVRWAAALVKVGTPAEVVTRWEGLRAAIFKHQRLLIENGIGVEVSERDRIRVNARRVGLEAPLFADEAEAAGFPGRPARKKQ